MSRVTVKQLQKEIEILKQRVLDLEKKDNYSLWWEKSKKCPCCGKREQPYKPHRPYPYYQEKYYCGEYE